MGLLKKTPNAYSAKSWARSEEQSLLSPVVALSCTRCNNHLRRNQPDSHVYLVIGCSVTGALNEVDGLCNSPELDVILSQEEDSLVRSYMREINSGTASFPIGSKLIKVVPSCRRRNTINRLPRQSQVFCAIFARRPVDVGRCLNANRRPRMRATSVRAIVTHWFLANIYASVQETPGKQARFPVNSLGGH